MSWAYRPRSFPPSHLGQYGRSLAQSRAPSPLALSRLAAYPRSHLLLATCPSGLKDWLREQERVSEEQLHFQVHWLPPNASWLHQIEIWFSLLQPNHFLSTAALEASLDEYIAYYNQTAKPINWTYTVEKLEQKLGNHL
jgi:hypothetical protein